MGLGVPIGTEPVDGDEVAGLPEKLTSSCAAASVGSEFNEGKSVVGSLALILLGLSVVVAVGTSFGDGDSVVGISETRFGFPVPDSDGRDADDGDVGRPDTTLGVSVTSTAGFEMVDGDGVVGLPVTIIGFLVKDGAEREDGDCVTGTPETMVGVSVVVTDGTEPVNGDDVPEFEEGDCVIEIPRITVGALLIVVDGNDRNVGLMVEGVSETSVGLSDIERAVPVFEDGDSVC